jgi:hypothetical protein
LEGGEVSLTESPSGRLEIKLSHIRLTGSPHYCIVIVQMRDGLQGGFDITWKLLVNGFKYFLQTINVSNLLLDIPLKQGKDFSRFCLIFL